MGGDGLAGGLTVEKQRKIAEMALNSMDEKVQFADNERVVNVKSNLNFDVLTDLTMQLCLDAGNLLPHKHHLNALVHLRNNIAHGSIPRSLTFEDFDQHATNLMGLMKKFEDIIFQAVEKRLFCTQ